LQKPSLPTILRTLPFKSNSCSHIFSPVLVYAWVGVPRWSVIITYCLPSFIFPEGIKEPSSNIQVILWCLTIRF
ncbi:hypothetical protein, partial [Tenacibaculum maritimum]|uniref:hypothetical protein n=1 Tax=Tenacibaculum maritimum TaxID=107401 RepID=UPI001E4C10E0